MKLKVILPFLGLLFASVINAEGDVKKFDQGRPIDENLIPKAYNASSRIDVQGAWDVFVDGEFLYWQINSDHLGYALISDADVTQPPHNATMVIPKAKWRPGVRLSLGFTLGYDNWMIVTDWYHIIGLSEGHAEVTTGTLFVPNVCDHVAMIASEAYQHGKANINILDFVFSRPYYLGTALTINPTFGVKGYWNNMSDHEMYHDVLYLLPAYDDAGLLDYVEINRTYKTWGIGPVFGAHINWLLGSGFRMLGGIDLALLYERANATTTASSSELIDHINSLDFLSLSVRKQNLIRSYTIGEFGLGWGKYFDDNNWYVDFSAVYEMHYWNQFYTADEPFGNLWMHGATFRIRLDF